MALDPQRVEADRQLIRDAHERGLWATLGAYTKLSGPGWLQSAITLGGGSLSGALYLGVLTGYSMLWLQLVAIVMGVIMLCTIAYVTLSTGERPFQAINKHINPVLGWSWAIASMMANIVWCLPQFALATAAVQQNLVPSVTELGEVNANLAVCIPILIVCISIVWIYDSGNWGIRLFEGLLKTMIAIIVLCFFGVVVRLSFSDAGLAWGEIAAGFVPDFSQFSRPATGFMPFLENVSQEYQQFWIDTIVNMQRDVMITAVATAVGINMTFLLPYSMLARGWGKDFRGLAQFDLATGMAIPFVLVTSCVVVASASRFHTEPGEGLADSAQVQNSPLAGGYYALLDKRLEAGLPIDRGSLIDQSDRGRLPTEEQAKLDQTVEEHLGLAKIFEKKKTGEKLTEEEQALLDKQRAALPEAEKRMAAMLVKRDAENLSAALEPLTGKVFGDVIFGIGVFGMGLSTIIILMLINGFVICEMFNLPQGGMWHRLGCMIPAIGVLGPFFWSDAKIYLAVPTSVFGMALLPIAYISFFLMLNSKSLLGEFRPKGIYFVIANLLAGIATISATLAASWVVWNKAGWYGVGGVGLLILLAIIVRVFQGSEPEEPTPRGSDAGVEGVSS